MSDSEKETDPSSVSSIPHLLGDDADNDNGDSAYKYRDFSHVKEDDDTEVAVENPPAAPSSRGNSESSIRVQKFPVKLYVILAQKEFHDIICWMPHGRAWKVLKPSLFESMVMPLFFEYSNYHSFNRLVNAWSFRRISSGPDRGSYYHELFLRGLPHLQKYMRRLPKTHKKLPMSKKDEPDFYAMDKTNRLPSLEDTTIPFLTPQSTNALQHNNNNNGNGQHLQSTQQQQQQLQRDSPPLQYQGSGGSGLLQQTPQQMQPQMVTPPSARAMPLAPVPMQPTAPGPNSLVHRYGMRYPQEVLPEDYGYEPVVPQHHLAPSQHGNMVHHPGMNPLQQVQQGMPMHPQHMLSNVVGSPGMMSANLGGYGGYGGPAVSRSPMRPTPVKLRPQHSVPMMDPAAMTQQNQVSDLYGNFGNVYDTPASAYYHHNGGYGAPTNQPTGNGMMHGYDAGPPPQTMMMNNLGVMHDDAMLLRRSRRPYVGLE